MPFRLLIKFKLKKKSYSPNNSKTITDRQINITILIITSPQRVNFLQVHLRVNRQPGNTSGHVKLSGVHCQNFDLQHVVHESHPIVAPLNLPLGGFYVAGGQTFENATEI